jgi:hypothetical protein
MAESPSLSIPLGVATPPAKRAAREQPRVATGLFAWYLRWLQRWEDTQRLREIDPHLAADIGAPPGADRHPAAYAADPRPLWGVGLTPRPRSHAGTGRDPSA